jgi:hypothetical protein
MTIQRLRRGPVSKQYGERALAGRGRKSRRQQERAKAGRSAAGVFHHVSKRTRPTRSAAGPSG